MLPFFRTRIACRNVSSITDLGGGGRWVNEERARVDGTLAHTVARDGDGLDLALALV